MILLFFFFFFTNSWCCVCCLLKIQPKLKDGMPGCVFWVDCIDENFLVLVNISADIDVCVRLTSAERHIGLLYFFVEFAGSPCAWVFFKCFSSPRKYKDRQRRRQVNLKLVRWRECECNSRVFSSIHSLVAANHTFIFSAKANPLYIILSNLSLFACGHVFTYTCIVSAGAPSNFHLHSFCSCKLMLTLIDEYCWLINTFEREGSGRKSTLKTIGKRVDNASEVGYGYENWLHNVNLN